MGFDLSRFSCKSLGVLASIPFFFWICEVLFVLGNVRLDFLAHMKFREWDSFCQLCQSRVVEFLGSFWIFFTVFMIGVS